jgi:hypothetical protein
MSFDTGIKKMAYKHLKEQYSAHDSKNIDLQLEVLKIVPRFFNDANSLKIRKPVQFSELQEIVSKMSREKTLGSHGWTKELFYNFFDVMGGDLLNAVEKSRTTGFIPGALNATFFALIPKISRPKNFNDFRPISLCNFAYKVISKIIASRIKDKLANCIYLEQFGFLKDRLIFDAVGISQECLQTAKLKKQNFVFLKLDLKKDYDNVI